MRLLQRGWSVNRVRKTMMVLATCFSPLAIVAVFSHSLFWTMTMISVVDLFLDPVVDHGPFAAGRLLSAACGWLRLRHRRNGFDRRVDDQHLGRRCGAGCDPQLRARCSSA